MKKAIVIILISIIVVVLSLGAYVKLFLPNVGAAPDLSVELTPERIARGEYLANRVMVCMDCHSSREWTAFSGPPVAGTLGMGGEYFGPEMGFPGAFHAPNITPAALQGWTDGEIFRAITTGVSRDNRPLFPIMPYSAYGKMDTEDIYAVIAYVRSLPAIENEVLASKAAFPMNFIMHTIPQVASPTPRPEKTDLINYGAYLVNAAACVDCHTPFEKGKLLMEKAFAGGREFAMPAGMVRSANITPDEETGIGRWDEETFIRRFQAYAQIEDLPRVTGNEMNTIMPWNMYGQLDSADLKAMYVYLASLAPIQHSVQVFDPLE